jgi:DNA polymerase III subunit delta'
VVTEDGSLPLPWLAEPLQQALNSQRGHALLLHGPQGIGQFELALSLAQSWLCEGVVAAAPACGHCASCKLVQAHSHPDLLVLLPEALRESLGWAQGDDAASDKTSKAKPSKEIKVEAVRAAVLFAQTTTARGRGKVVLIHPAERMNAIAANTLLKTLEEPPGQARFILSCGAPDALLPTIRSRCQAVPMRLPPTELAREWLAHQQVAQPEVLLAAAGGQPLEALLWAQEGQDATSWLRLPRQLAAGEVGTLANWPLPRLLDAMQKLCHDLLCVASGAAPRYFPASCLPQGATVSALSAWSQALSPLVRHAEHPWSLPVMAESLVAQARQALAGKSPRQRSA